MDKNYSFEFLSLTHLRQEQSIINTVLAQIQYSASNSLVKINLNKFESKTLRGISNEGLLERVQEVLTRLKKLKVIFSFESTPDDGNIFFEINIGSSLNPILTYKSDLANEIEKKEIYVGLIKKNRWAKLDEKNMSFTLELQNGEVISVTFLSKERGNRMFLVFKILFDDWVNNPNGSGISKAELVNELKKYDLVCSERDIKDTVGSIRTFKIRGTGLKNYIEIIFSRREFRYRLNIKRIL